MPEIYIIITYTYVYTYIYRQIISYNTYFNYYAILVVIQGERYSRIDRCSHGKHSVLFICQGIQSSRCGTDRPKPYVSGSLNAAAANRDVASKNDRPLAQWRAVRLVIKKCVLHLRWCQYSGTNMVQTDLKPKIALLGTYLGGQGGARAMVKEQEGQSKHMLRFISASWLNWTNCCHRV